MLSALQITIARQKRTKTFKKEKFLTKTRPKIVEHRGSSPKGPARTKVRASSLEL
jgi:hypothetical protein